MKAIFNGKVIAESDKTIVVEGNHYFPPDAVAANVLRSSDTNTVCSWKGTAAYHSVEVDGKLAKDAAWYYPKPLDKAAKLGISGYLAFWNGVEITA